jgi:two-component system phosphate regulon sensor histidine kinase PhoR
LNSGLYQEIRRYLAAIIALLAIGYFSGYMLACITVGLFSIIAWQLVNANRILLWLQKKSGDEIPALSGIWSDLVKKIVKLKKRLKHSRNSRQDILNRVEDITSSLPNGVVLLSKDLNLDWWNRPAEKFLTLKPSQQGQHIIDVVPSMAFGEFILTGDFSHSVEIIHPDNKYLVLNFSAAPFGNDETILMIQDVSQLRHLEQIRKDFVDNISHELRTPLTVISGYIENLQFAGDSLPPSFQKALLQMEQQASRMTDLTNNLLMLSRVESVTAPRPTLTLWARLPTS